MAGYQGEYKVDIAFVIDATGSMGPIIEQLKRNTRTLCDEIRRVLRIWKPDSSLRMRIIDFADFAFEGEDAIHVSPFFAIPDEKEQFENYVKGIKYYGRGGDKPENGLEALWEAMKADWGDWSIGTRGRQAIVVITDAFPLHLRVRAGCKGYVVENYPSSIREMEEARRDNIFGGPNEYNKRLLLFAPKGKDVEGHSWEEVYGWSGGVLIPVKPGNGLGEWKDNFDEFIHCILEEICWDD